MSPRALVTILAIALAAAGTGLVVLSIHSVLAPRAFMWYERDGTVYRFDPLHSTSQQVMVLPKVSGNSPPPLALSGDAKLIAVTDNHGLKILRIEDGAIVQEVAHKWDDPNPTSLTNTSYVPLLWSPDDRWLLIQLRRYEQQGLGFLDVGAGTILEIGALDQTQVTCGYSGAAWSEDSRQIIITNDNPEVCEWGQASPGVLNASPSFPRLGLVFSQSYIASDGHSSPFSVDGSADMPAWQPHTAWLAFSQTIAWQFTNPWGVPVSRIFLMRSDGTLAHAITLNNAGTVDSPVWDHSGQLLFFTAQGTESFEDGVYESRADGTGARLLMRGTDIAPMAVSPDDAYLAIGYRSVDSIRFPMEPYSQQGMWVLNLRDNQKIYVGSAQFVGWQMLADER